MTKVLHIFGIMNRGGAEMRTLEIMPHLQEKGIHFDFCTLGDGVGVLDERISQQGGKVINCPLSMGMRRFKRVFCELVTSGGYDVVHSHVYYFSGKILQLAHRAGAKRRVAHFRSLHDGKPLTLKRRLYHAYMKYLIDRHATDILAVCQGVMDSSWKHWKADSRCRVIYNGLDREIYLSLQDTRFDVCTELNIDYDNKILINVGRFNFAKAHDVLLKAMARIIKVLPDSVLLLVGEGDLKEEMIQKAATLGIERHVRFLGLRNDVPRLLKAADCFVLSSRREGLPGVVLEALAANLPVVATDLPGVLEIAAYSSKIKLVPLEDSVATAKMTIDVLSDTREKTSKSDVFPSTFDLSFCVNSFCKVYLKE